DHEHGIGRDGHRDAGRDLHHSDVDPVLGPDQHVGVRRAQAPQDHLFEQLRRRLAGPLLAHLTAPWAARNRSTAATSERVAVTGSGADATAEITATPTAPASRTSAAFSASMPPMPTTGRETAPTTARTPSRPQASASG